LQGGRVQAVHPQGRHPAVRRGGSPLHRLVAGAPGDGGRDVLSARALRAGGVRRRGARRHRLRVARASPRARRAGRLAPAYSAGLPVSPVPRLLRDAAAKAPQRPAVVIDGGPTLRYAELLARSENLAAWLAGRGVRRGDRVVVRAAGGVVHFDACLAVAHLGAACVPVPATMAEAAVARLVEDARPALGLSDAGGATALRRSGLETLVADSADYRAAVSPRQPDTTQAPSSPPAPGDTVLISYTSGTTGDPKGVCLSQATVARNAAMTERDQGFGTHEVYLSATPLYHASAGLRIFTMLHGAHTHVVLPRFSPEGWLRVVENKRVTSTIAVPTQIQRILDHPEYDPARLKSLRLLVYGAGPSTRSLILRMRRELPCGLYHGYGLTESCAVVCGFDAADHQALTGPDDPRLGSVGRPLPGVEVRLRRPVGGDAAAGEVGEILIRAPKLMSGYWGNPAATAEALSDGWLRTGDLATADGDGYLTLAGRSKDVIISGGVNLHPAQIERVLVGHPGVAEAAVFGVSHPEWGEVPVAAVRPEPNADPPADELANLVGDELDRRSRPRRVVFVEDFPRTATGKIRRSDLPLLLD
ncbi:MAG: long-chain fatty acid--CoA ligase, partial [Acidimicrobiia bacterium]|nr:long-chain fatty acid--CoA ligase [Acidimicrobiia bacterium]